MITRWSPLREMSAMQRLMDRMFEDWRPYVNEENGGSTERALALDVHEDEKTYTVTTEMPGVQPDHIQVRHEGDYLVIEGTISEDTEHQDKKALVKERRYGHYSRRLRLPQNINFDAAEAQYENGVLRLTLPKTEAPQPKLIPIKTGKA
jgi:HSP20 family protein